jgi:hypothetical protein
MSGVLFCLRAVAGVTSRVTLPMAFDRGDRSVKHLTSLSAALLFAGCVGNGVEYGGVGSPADVPAAAVPCNEAGVQRDVKGRMFIPDEVVMFFMAAQQNQAVKTMRIHYDVNEIGKALNARYIGPPEQLRHATWQKLIRAASDYVQTSTYKWTDTPAFATGCEFELAYIIDWDRGPDGSYDQGKKERD